MWSSDQRDGGHRVGDHNAKRQRRIHDRLAQRPASAECEFRDLRRRTRYNGSVDDAQPVLVAFADADADADADAETSDVAAVPPALVGAAAGSPPGMAIFG